MSRHSLASGAARRAMRRTEEAQVGGRHHLLDRTARVERARTHCQVRGLACERAPGVNAGSGFGLEVYVDLSVPHFHDSRLKPGKQL